MKQLTDEEILATWEAVTDFTGGWTEAIQELLARIEDMINSMSGNDYIRDRLDDLKQRVIDLKHRINDTARDAHNGEISAEDLENLFRDYGEELSQLEEEMLEIEFEDEGDIDYFLDEEEEEY